MFAVVPFAVGGAKPAPEEAEAGEVIELTFAHSIPPIKRYGELCTGDIDWQFCGKVTPRSRGRIHVTYHADGASGRLSEMAGTLSL